MAVTHPAAVRTILADAVVDSIDCFGDFGAIEILPLTGVDPFQFLWDDGSVDQNRNDLLAGFHSVVITDDIGCIHDASQMDAGHAGTCSSGRADVMSIFRSGTG